MSDAESLENLMAEAANGNREAFRRLYSATASKLFGVALRICRDRSMAEDAVQAAYVEIWRNAGKYVETRGRALSWMQTIARNRAIDQIRRRGRVWSAGGDYDGAVDLVDTLPDPAAGAGSVERMALAACLERLDERGRKMVLLAYYEGFSREELSVRFDAPVNTIKTILRRALAALRGCLEE